MQFYGVGFNSGKFGFKSSHKIEGKWIPFRAYSIWSSMLKRCYSNSPEYLNYASVTVDPEWHDYQDFALWYESQPDYRKNNGWQLDKDILGMGLKTYSAKTCRLVPTQINVLIRKMAERDYTQGVNFHKKHGKLRAYLKGIDGKVIEKNGFNTELEAFLWYKNQKEAVIREIANTYKSQLDADIYNALINYEIISERFKDVFMS